MATKKPAKPALPSDDDIADVVNACAEAENGGTSKYPGMSYEQGVKAAIQWLEGDGPNPMED